MMRARATRWLTRASFAAAAALPLACQIITGLDHPEPRDTATSTTDASAAPPNDAGVPYACTRAVLDDTHASAAGGSDSLLFVVSHLDWNSVSDGGSDYCERSGFDLDDKPTCQTASGYRSLESCIGDAGDDAVAALLACAWGPSCRPNPDASLQRQCDDPDGVDNALGGFIERASKNLEIPIPVGREPPDLNALFVRGISNLLIRVDGYNKTPEDDDVSVSFFGSSGLAATVAAEPDAAYAEGTQPWRVKWDGHALREWYVDPLTVRATSPVFTSKYVYSGRVRAGVLVVHVAQMPSPFTLQAPVGLQNAVFSGELKALPDGSWTIVRGRLAGSVGVQDVLDTMLRIPFGSTEGHQRACDSDLLRGYLTESVCEIADLAGDGGECDRVSVAAGFVAVPALLGPQRRLELPFAPCDAEVACR